MTWFWSLPAILLFSLAFVFYPLFTQRGSRPLPVGLEGDPLTELTFERDRLLRQLKEIDLEEGDNPEGEEEKRRLESELAAVLVRLDGLKVAAEKEQKKNSGVAATASINKGWGVSVILLVSLVSSGLYLLLGTPKEVPPTQEKQAVSESDIKDMVQRLAERMQEEPENKKGWMQLARSYGVLGEMDKAIQAYTHVLSLDPNDLEVAVALAEVQVRSGESEGVKAGLTLFQDILTKDPDNTEALWFMGVVAFQLGERDVAIKRWQRLLEKLEPGSQDYENVLEAMEQAKGQ
ncbi:MAG: tetratricopeptide repeat protein [Magnetococcales bacterium]|nr:tetratricopeptide repeat protein [Magnetococcales bacterium]